MRKWLVEIWSDDGGQDLTEYALLLALLALGAIAAIGGLASTVSNMFQGAASNIENATGG